MKVPQVLEMDILSRLPMKSLFNLHCHFAVFKCYLIWLELPRVLREGMWCYKNKHGPSQIVTGGGSVVKEAPERSVLVKIQEDLKPFTRNSRTARSAGSICSFARCYTVSASENAKTKGRLNEKNEVTNFFGGEGRCQQVKKLASKGIGSSIFETYEEKNIGISVSKQKWETAVGETGGKEEEADNGIGISWEDNKTAGSHFLLKIQCLQLALNAVWADATAELGKRRSVAADFSGIKVDSYLGQDKGNGDTLCRE